MDLTIQKLVLGLLLYTKGILKNRNYKLSDLNSQRQNVSIEVVCLFNFCLDFTGRNMMILRTFILLFCMQCLKNDLYVNLTYMCF